MDLIQKANNLGFVIKNKEYHLWEIQKWLREKHNIHIVCWWYDKEDKFYTELGRKTKEKIFVQCGNTTLLFNTYEEALEEGLYKALKLIK